MKLPIIRPVRLWFAVVTVIGGLATPIKADTIPAAGGEIELTAMAHAHVQLQYGGKVIHIDPSTMANYANAKPADIILITDIHPDHLDRQSIERLAKRSVAIVASEAVAAVLDASADPMRSADLSTAVVIVNNGETTEIEGITVQAVAAYNLRRGPQQGQLYHTKGRGNAYVATLGGKRILFTGDTECTPELRALRDIDVAFVTMNLPFTMSPEEAAECVRAFRPAVVYPYHYRQQGLEPVDKNARDFAALMKGTPGIDVRLMDFYPTR